MPRLVVPVVPEGGEHSYGGSPGFFSSCSVVLSHTPDPYFKVGWISSLIVPSADFVGLYHLPHLDQFSVLFLYCVWPPLAQ